MSNKCTAILIVTILGVLLWNFSRISIEDEFHSCVAVLVEFRRTDRIISVVDNVHLHIPLTWPIQIFHGEENEDFIRSSTLAPWIASGRILLTSIKSIKEKSDMNRLLTDVNFWKQIHGEKILFFQIDSIMCSNSPHRITDYLHYDYIGAPWNPTWYPQHPVGNGGFSLRSRSKILALLALIPYNVDQPEDVWYSQNLYRVNASIPSMEIAKTFAVESIFYERPLGVHRFPWRCDFRRKLSQTCPEAVMVLPNGGC